MNDSYTDQARNEIADLRAKVEALMTERVTPALVNAAEHAGTAARDASDQVRHQADRVSASVRENPFAALGIAALAGFVVAALMRR